MRYGRPLSVILMRNAAKAPMVSPFTLKWLKTVSSLQDALSAADLAGKASRNDYLIVLPETDHAGALAVVRRLAETLKEFDVELGIAELRAHRATAGALLNHARTSKAREPAA